MKKKMKWGRPKGSYQSEAAKEKISKAVKKAYQKKMLEEQK